MPLYQEGIFFIPQRSTLQILKCQAAGEEKETAVVYDYKSLYLFSSEGRFRNFVVRMVHHPFFENFIILVIFANTFDLAVYDYNDRDDLTQHNQLLEKASKVYTIIFTVELVVKVIAQGFMRHRNSYLRDPWNWLDFTVVIVGLLEFLPFVSLSVVKALRVLRVLRPLRSVKQFPSMRRLIDALLSSLPSLANAVVFMFFIFLLFGILGVQQFPGTMYQRCRLSESPNYEDNTWPYDEDVAGLCRKAGQGESQCPAGTFCFGPEDGGLSRDIDKPWE